MILTSVPNPLKKLSICCRSFSVTSELKLVSKCKLSSGKSDTSNDSEFSETSLDGELWSLIELSRCLCAI